MDALAAAIQKKLQYAVSGDKVRYKDHNYDLDLTYVRGLLYSSNTSLMASEAKYCLFSSNNKKIIVNLISACINTKTYSGNARYITKNIIAMGIPGDGASAAWRNDIKSVSKFLNSNHPRRYMLFNLSGEKYDYGYFDRCVRDYGWPDHQYVFAPPKKKKPRPPVSLLSVRLLWHLFGIFASQWMIGSRNIHKTSRLFIV